MSLQHISGRKKVPDFSGITSGRNLQLRIEEAEPNLGFATEKTLPIQNQYYQLVTWAGAGITERYWQQAPAGVITAISIFNDGNLVGTGNSINKLDFRGVAVDATAYASGTISTITVSPPGNNTEILFVENADFSTSSAFSFDPSNIEFQVGIGGTVLKTFTDGSVGFGTTSPLGKVHIEGDLKLSGTIIDSNDQSGQPSNILVKGNTGLEWTQASSFTSGAGGDFTNVQYRASTGLLAGASNFVYTPSSGGRVGIGTTTPTQLLEVSGSSLFDGNVELSGITTFSSDGQVQFNSTINSNIVPTNNTYEIGSASTSWSKVYATDFVGLAASATKLKDLKSFALSGDVTASEVTFNGTQDVSLTTLLSTIPNLTANTQFGSGLKNVQITVDSKGRVTQIGDTDIDFSGAQVGTANSLTTPQDFSISGDGVAAPISFNGTGPVGLALTLNTIGGLPTASVGDSTNVPVITVNEKGIVTVLSSTPINLSTQTVQSANTVKVEDRTTGVNYLTFVENNTGTNAENLYANNNLVYDAANSYLGINTTQPTNKLSVVGNTDIKNGGLIIAKSSAGSSVDSINLKTTDGGNAAGTSQRITFESDVVDAFITGSRDAASGPGTSLRLGTFGGEAIRIKSTGANQNYIGIGTISADPQYTLEVYGDFKVRSRIIDRDGNTGSSNQLLISDSEGLVVWGNSTGAAAGQSIQQISNTDPYYITFSKLTSGIIPEAYIDTSFLIKESNVGLGTDDPLARLHVYSDSELTSIIARSTSGNVVTEYRNSSNQGVFVGFLDGQGFAINNTASINSNPQLIVSRSSGNLYVGISPGSSDQKLQVNGGAYYSGNIGIGETNPTFKLQIGNSTDGGGTILSKTIRYTNSTQDEPYLIVGSRSYNGNTNNWGSYGIQHRFKSRAGTPTISRVTIDSVDPNESSAKELFCVTNEAKVGINTDNPDYNLHVNGDVYLKQRLIDSNTQQGTPNQVLTTTGTGVSWKSIADVPGSSDATTIQISRNTTNLGIQYIPFTNTNSSTGGQQNLYTNEKIVFDLQNTKVGIGTSIPNYTLDVNGDLYLRGSIADYSAQTGSEGNILVSLGSGIGVTWKSTNNISVNSASTATNATRAGLATNLEINGTNQLIYQSGNNATEALAAGTTGYLLQSEGGTLAPSWVSLDDLTATNATNATRAGLATDLEINGTNQLIYQAGVNNTDALAAGDSGQILQSNGSSNPPSWIDVGDLDIGYARTAGFATDLNISASNQLIYQSGDNATEALAAGTTGYLLQSEGGTLAPSWVDVGNLSVQNAQYATRAGLATDLEINASNQLIYQAGVNNTGILTAGDSGQILQSGGSSNPPSWISLNNLTVGSAGYATRAGLATNLEINGTNRLVYQSGNNTTGILTAGESNQILQSNGSSNPPSWIGLDNLTVGSAGYASIAGFSTNAGLATDLKINALNQLIYQSANNATDALAAGTTGYLLQSNGGTLAPSWVDVDNLTAGTATYAVNAGLATNLEINALNQLIYQSGNNATDALGAGTTDQILQSNGGTTPPSWVDVDNLTAGTASNLGIAATNRLLYQSGVNNTDALAAGTPNQILQSNGSSNPPSWVDLSNISAGLASDIGINGSNQLLYQASNNDTNVLGAGVSDQILQSRGPDNPPIWTNLDAVAVGVADSLSLSGTNQIVYQSSDGVTGVLSTGDSGELLQSNGSTSAPDWVSKNDITVGFANSLALNGTNQLVYQASNNDTNVLGAGTSDQILQSNGPDNPPSWVDIGDISGGIASQVEIAFKQSADSPSEQNYITFTNKNLADGATAVASTIKTYNAFYFRPPSGTNDAKLYVGGQIQATKDAFLLGNVELGNTITDPFDKVTFNSRVGSNVVAFASITYNLGSSDSVWNVVYANKFEGSLGIAGTNQLVYQVDPNTTDVLSAGQTGQILQSNGDGNAPTWVDNTNLSEANVGLANSLALNGTNQLVYQSANDQTNLIGVGTTGYLLQSNGSTSAPSWTDLQTLSANKSFAYSKYEFVNTNTVRSLTLNDNNAVFFLDGPNTFLDVYNSGQFAVTNQASLGLKITVISNNSTNKIVRPGAPAALLIMGASEDLDLDLDYVAFDLVFTGLTKGWVVV